MHNTRYSSDETCRLAGVTYRQLDHWCTKDVFGNHVQFLQSGHRREFTWDDVTVAYVLSVLHRDLISLDGRKNVSLGSNTALYRKIAELVRDKGMHDTYVVRIGDNSRLTIEVDFTDLMSRSREKTQV